MRLGRGGATSNHWRSHFYRHVWSGFTFLYAARRLHHSDLTTGPRRMWPTRKATSTHPSETPGSPNCVTWRSADAATLQSRICRNSAVRPRHFAGNQPVEAIRLQMICRCGAHYGTTRCGPASQRLALASAASCASSHSTKACSRWPFPVTPRGAWIWMRSANASATPICLRGPS